MKHTVFSASLMVLMAALLPLLGHCEEQRIIVGPGDNVPLGIIVFPPSAFGNDVVESWTVADIFGPQNEAGILAATNPEFADIIQLPAPDGNQRPVFFHPTNGWQFADDNNDASNFVFPITTGLIFQRTGPDPLELVFQGEFRRLPIDVDLQPGQNLINRTFADPFTLGSIELENSLNRNEDPFLADIVQIPELALQLYIDGAGQWRDLNRGDPVDPFSVEIGAIFVIIRNGAPTIFPFFPLDPPPAVQLPPQVLSEGSPGRVDGIGVVPLENVCLLGIGDRLIPLRVAQATGEGGLIFQTGKVPEQVSVGAIGVSRGAGELAPIAATVNLDFRDPVWTFQSETPLSEQVPFSGTIAPKPLRDGEFRFFSVVEDGALSVTVDAIENWPAGTLVDLTLVAFLDSGSKIAFATNRIRLQTDLPQSVALESLGEFLATTLGARGIFDEREIDVEVNLVPAGGQRMSVGFPPQITDGILDICIQIPPPPPVIESVTGTVFSDGILVIDGADFGDRPDDLCVALVGEGTTSSIGMRTLAVSESGTRLFAQVTGVVDDATPRRVTINRGRGATRRFIFGFPDLIQNQGIWVWESLGVEAGFSSEMLTPALAFDNEVCSKGTLAGGTLRNTLPDAWPDHARVRVTFTANSRNQTLDYYAPDLCFTEAGPIENCAERIREVIGSAFIQEGMANGNALVVQETISAEGATTLEANLFTPTGAPDPITDGHFDVCHAADAQCDVPELDDRDGDGLDDDWEQAFFGDPPEDVDPDGNPDGDENNTRAEFAFQSDPFVFNARQLESVFIDPSARPAISYFQHESGPRAFHYSLEISRDAINWQETPSFDIRASRLGTERVQIIAVSRLTTGQLGAAQFRVRATPRLP